MRACLRCCSIYSTPVERCGLDGDRLVEVETDPLIGRTIDRYRIARRLGEGGMGCVYVGAHQRIARDFAIKVLFGDMASNRDIAERFRREARSLSQLEHPNVVSIVDFGETEAGLLYLATELIRGKTLAQLLKEEKAQKRRMLMPQAARLIRQIAFGLAEAHGLGFVHRDLKPANVMVLTKRGEDFVKILDFGVVGIVNVPADTTTPTPISKLGQLLGTPAYMAPEQIEHPTVEPAADLYALGVILYEMLSGVVPFEGSLQEVLRKKLSGAPAPPPSAGGLEQLALALLDGDPARRPRSAEVVIQEIDRIMAIDSEATAFFPPPAFTLAGPTIPASVPVAKVEVDTEKVPMLDAAVTDRHAPANATLVRPIVERAEVRAGVPWRTAAIVALAVGAGAVGGVYFAGGVRPMTEPITVQALPLPVEKSPPPSEAVRPHVQAASVEARPIVPTHVLKLEPRPQKAAAKAAEPQKPAPKLGSLSVHVLNTAGDEIGGEIFVDGRSIQRQSPMIGLPIPPGEHRISVKTSNGVMLDPKTVMIAPDGAETANFFEK